MESSALKVSPQQDTPATSIDIGLRQAERMLRERVVPGTGSIWFGRQLCWSSAALVLHNQINNRAVTMPAPSIIADGIEALATKAALFCKGITPRYLGQDLLDPRRRDAHRTDWTFATLSNPINYVRTTHRVAATRAMRTDGGLGLARGSRFDAFLLEPSGRALGEAFLQQPVSDTDTLATALVRWLQGDDILTYAPMTLHATLGAHGVTDDERGVLGEILVAADTDGAAKRRNLAAILGPLADFPGVEETIVPALANAGHGLQANEILAARAFGALLDTTHAAVASLTQVLGEHGSLAVGDAVRLPVLSEALDEAQISAHMFKRMAREASFEEPSALYFAEAVERATSAEAILRRIMQRVPQLINASKTTLSQGTQFRLVAHDRDILSESDGADKAEPDRSAFRLANFHSLLRDLSAQG